MVWRNNGQRGAVPADGDTGPYSLVARSLKLQRTTHTAFTLPSPVRSLLIVPVS